MNYIVSFISVGIFGFALLFIVASFEVNSYKKFCNENVTAWDAMFLDLRIDECDKNHNRR